MHHSEIWRMINVEVQRALQNQVHMLSTRELSRRVDQLLLRLPATGGGQLTTASLLRRHRVALQQALCDNRRPRPLPASIEDEIRELTRVVMIAVQHHGSFSVETAVLLALVIRASGIETLCMAPTEPATSHGHAPPS